MFPIAVVGMWHLGPVTAACLSSVGHAVIALDEDQGVIGGLAEGRLPVAEPGLADIIRRECETGRLRFSTCFEDSAACKVVWMAYDTPVDDKDIADVEFVHRQSLRILEHVGDGTVFVVSSQMPTGSIARLEREFAPLAAGRRVSFACAPENLRLGKAIEVFLSPDRVVLGVRDEMARATLEAVYHRFTNRIEWMSVESAELTKHSINAFLATSICFANEIAAMCEITGADALEVERGLKTDQRIGTQAYLHAGGAIAGGTLARDVTFLQSLANAASTRVPLIDAVQASNEHHKTWIKRRLSEALPTLSGCTVALLGLTYKPGTNTLRRSAAVELARWLGRKGACVRAFDPEISELPEELRSVLALGDSVANTLHGADALVVMTPWPQLQSLDPILAPPIVFDPSRCIDQVLSTRRDIRYYSIGRPS